MLLMQAPPFSAASADVTMCIGTIALILCVCQLWQIGKFKSIKISKTFTTVIHPGPKNGAPLISPQT